MNGPDAAAQVRAVAFDCYGTLLNYEERAFAPAVGRLLQRYGVAHVDGDAVWTEWRNAAREYNKHHGRDPKRPLDGPEPPFRPLAEVWPEHFGHAFEHAKVKGIHPEHATEFLFAELRSAPPYPETPQIMERLRAAGFAVAVASNADDVHLLPAIDAAGINIDAGLVLSSESARSYKPRRPFFEALMRRLGLAPHEVLYVGDSPVADVVGARNVGMPVYWVQRYARTRDNDDDERPAAEPSWTFPDLRGLLTILPGAQP